MRRLRRLARGEPDEPCCQEGVRHLAVDPNGARFAIVTDAGSLLVIDVSGAEVLVHHRAEEKP